MIRCPKCSHVADVAGSVFVERGEYDGKSYEAEGQVDLFRCMSPHCRCLFAVDVPELETA